MFGMKKKDTSFEFLEACAKACRGHIDVVVKKSEWSNGIEVIFRDVPKEFLLEEKEMEDTHV